MDSKDLLSNVDKKELLKGHTGELYAAFPRGFSVPPPIPPRAMYNIDLQETVDGRVEVIPKIEPVRLRQPPALPARPPNVNWVTFGGAIPAGLEIPKIGQSSSIKSDESSSSIFPPPLLTFSSLSDSKDSNLAVTSESTSSNVQKVELTEVVSSTGLSTWYAMLDRKNGESVYILSAAITLHQYCVAIYKFGHVSIYFDGAMFWASVDLESLKPETKKLLIAFSEQRMTCEDAVTNTLNLYKEERNFTKIDSEFQSLLDENEATKGKILKNQIKTMQKFSEKMSKTEKNNPLSDYRHGKAFWKNLDRKLLSRNYKISLFLLNGTLSAGEIHSLWSKVYVGNYSL